jgi:hypothetical protein
MLVKYQALALVAFPLLAISVRCLGIVADDGMRAWRALRGPLGAALALAALTAPHWLKNWVWYGDPVYRFLHHVLAVRLWTIAASLCAMLRHQFPGELLFGRSRARHHTP